MAGAAVFGPRGEGWGEQLCQACGEGGSDGLGLPCGRSEVCWGCSAHPVATAGDGMVLGEYVHDPKSWKQEKQELIDPAPRAQPTLRVTQEGLSTHRLGRGRGAGSALPTTFMAY